MVGAISVNSSENRICCRRALKLDISGGGFSRRSLSWTEYYNLLLGKWILTPVSDGWLLSQVLSQLLELLQFGDLF